LAPHVIAGLVPAIQGSSAPAALDARDKRRHDKNGQRADAA